MAKFGKEYPGSHPFWQLKDGQVVTLALEIDVAALGNGKRVVERFRHLAEQDCHFFRTAQKVAVARHVHAIFIGEQFAGLDTQQDILQLGIFAANVMHIIGGNQVAPLAPCQIDHLAIDFGHQGIIMLLQFKEKIIFPKGLQVPIGSSVGLLKVFFLQCSGYFPGKAS